MSTCLVITTSYNSLKLYLFNNSAFSYNISCSSLRVFSSKLYLRLQLTSEWTSVSNAVTTLLSNQDYYIKFDYNNTSGYRVYLSTTGAFNGEETLELSLNDTTLFNQSNNYIGIGSGGDNDYVSGSIDLKHFSITVDGENVFNGLMESTKPIYDKIATTNTTLSTFQTDTDNNFSAVNSALNEKANLSDLAGYVTVNKYNELLARVVALETEINGGNA